MQSPVEEIKARLDIVEVIGTYVELKRSGANFKARCPFHQEKTPSFMVSKPKQMWYCFGCSEGGDIFKFVMKIDGMEFPEALKLLADKSGVELPRYDARAQSQKNTLMEIVKAATDFYVAQLHEPRGQLARDYLSRRGLSQAIIKQFGLGYAPDTWDALTLSLRDKFKAEEVFAAGMTIPRTAYGSSPTVQSASRQLPAVSSYYDRFRHRIMFPIRDVHGNPVGFTSRLLDEKRAEGKYVNTPETPIYSKGRLLYGLDLAREPIRRNDYAVIVEGNMDVIACHQFGMNNVVAASGTALTLEQVRLLKRYTNNLMISFDADVAGEHASKRGIDIALLEGMRVKVITIPTGCGKDPDECIRSNLKQWEQAVRGAKEIMEYYIAKAVARYPVTTAAGRSQLVHALLVEIKKLPDAIEQDFWITRVGEVAKVDDKLLRDQMRKVGSTTLPVKTDKFPSPDLRPLSPSGRGQGDGMRPRTELLSERLLALFLFEPSVRQLIIGTVLPDMLTPKTHQDLYTQLASCYTAYTSTGSALAGADFSQFWHTWLEKNKPTMLSTADPGSSSTTSDHYGASIPSILELLGDKEFDSWVAKEIAREADLLCSEIRRDYTKKRRFAISSAMREAEARGDRATVETLTREFGALEK